MKISERKLKTLERDAARYRFLRKSQGPQFEIGVWQEDGNGLPVPGGWLNFEELDREIDIWMDRAKELKNIKCRKEKS